MKNTTSIITVLAIVGLSIALLNSNNPVSAVQAQEEFNSNDFEYILHITDIIPYYTWDGISKVLTNGQESFEDVDVIRVVIQSSDFYAVYNNNVSENTFEFAGIYENGA